MQALQVQELVRIPACPVNSVTGCQEPVHQASNIPFVLSAKTAAVLHFFKCLKGAFLPPLFPWYCSTSGTSELHDATHCKKCQVISVGSVDRGHGNMFGSKGYLFAIHVVYELYVCVFGVHDVYL